MPDLASASAGLVAGIRTVIGATALAALVFSADLAPGLPQGISLMLFSAFALSLLVCALSSYPGVVAQPQDAAAAVGGLMAASIFASLPGDMALSARLASVFAAIALTTLLTGAVFLAMGWFRLGALVRFIPYPVIGGFLAGSGWLFVTGAFGLMTGGEPLLEARALVVWLPGVVFALLLLAAMRRQRHPLLMPALLAGAIALFYVTLLAAGIGVAEAGSRGWLLGPFPQGAAWRPSIPLGAIEWGVLAAELPKMLTIVGVSVVGLMLNASGLELATRRDLDIDRELSAAGAANLASGVLGGFAGYQALGVSLLGARMGANSRVIGAVCALVCLAALLAGPALVSYVPRAVLGGLLLFMGLGFLVEWLYDARRHLPGADYAIVVLIVVAISVVGYMGGVGVGILVAALLFVVRFSQVEVIRSSLPLAEVSSSVERSAAERRLLGTLGGDSRTFNLSGYLFFGSANSFLERIRVLCERDARGAYFLFNFRRVSGIDITAAQVFSKLGNLLDAKGVTPIYCGLSEPVAQTFELAGVFKERERLVLGDLDLALRWVEDRLLAGQEVDRAGGTVGARLEGILGDRDKAERLAGIMTRQELSTGEPLFRQGDAGGALYVVESGAIEVRLEHAGRITRLREFRAGSMVGEMAVYTATKTRTASAVAMEPTVLYRLALDDLKRLGERTAEYELIVHELIARRLAARLGFMNQRTEADL